MLNITGTDLGPNKTLLLVLISVLLILGAASDVSVQLLYTHFRQKVTNGLDILAAIVYPSLAAVFVLIGWGVAGAMLSLLITTIISVAISLWLAWRMLATMPDEGHLDSSQVKRPSTRPLRDRLISFAGLNYLINWSVYFYDLPFVVLAIGILVSSSRQQQVEIALISLAYKFTCQFLRALVVPLTGVQTPLRPTLRPGAHRWPAHRVCYGHQVPYPGVAARRNRADRHVAQSLAGLLWAD